MRKTGLRKFATNLHSNRPAQQQKLLRGLTLCVSGNFSITYTIVIFLSFRTDRSGQTVQIQIRMLLEEQSDQGLYCLQFLDFVCVWYL